MGVGGTGKARRPLQFFVDMISYRNYDAKSASPTTVSVGKQMGLGR